MSILRAALASLRAGRRRTLLSAVGLLLAGAMAGAAVTLAYGLGTGFDRSTQRADLPDVIADFASQPEAKVDKLVSALPNVEARSYRATFDNARLFANGHSTTQGSINFVDTTARRGYRVIAGHDLTSTSDQVLIEEGLAKQWHLKPGDTIVFPGRGAREIAGVAVQPDNVAFPLATAPRVWVSLQAAERRFGAHFEVDQALIWTKDPSRTNVTLQQARATAASIKDLRFITKGGVKVLIDQAAGIVIALLGAFSLIALGAAAVMLASQAAADVQRRLPTIGIQRAIGVPRRRVAAEHGLAAFLLALLAGGLGVAVGATAVTGPADGLLHTLNELSPGTAVLPPLIAVVLLVAVLVGLCSAVPAWRAAGRRPVELLRGAELRHPARRWLPGGGFLLLGARLGTARRGRAGLTIAVLAASGGVVLLMLGLSSLLVALKDDPGAVGKRYALTAQLPADRTGDVQALPGVADAAPRYVVQAADSFALGEPVKLLAIPGDHTTFENPPVASGRRENGPGEAEIGTGLAEALGVGPGGTLAVQLQSGAEVRFKIVGTVRALDQDGRIAYVRPDRLLAADPTLGNEIVVRLKRGASKAKVTQELIGLGARPASVGGATTRSGAFLDVLAALLRVVALLDALVCLYALVQALALVAQERRPTLAGLRAQGAGARTIASVLTGAALALALPAVLAAALLEALVLAPLTGRLAAGYADLGAGATGIQIFGVGAAFVVLALLAAARVTRRTTAAPPVNGLRDAA